MSHYKPYATYKYSGAELLGDVPAHWKVTPFKWEIDRNDGGVWGEDPDGLNDTIILRSTEQTVDGNWKLDDPAPRKISEIDREFSLLLTGDLLVTKSSGSSLHIGKTTLVSTEIEMMGCCYSNFMQRIRTKSSFIPKLAWYVMNNNLARSQFDFLSNTTTGLANLNATMIGQILITVPKIEEQCSIVAHLDYETARIDDLVSKKNRFIELLREKRQALITHAVTKGLDTSVKMKDSGVEWLGDVPEHWGVKRIKYLAMHTGSGKTPSGGAEVYQDSGVLFLRSQNVHDDGLRLNDVAYISEEIDQEMRGSRVFQGDVLLNITGASIGRSCLVQTDIGPANVNQHVCIVRTTKLDIARWISECFLSSVIKAQIDFFQNGAGREGLNFEQIGNMVIALPPMGELITICSVLVKSRNRLDNLVRKTERSIELLKERRSALITAAVTGQIDLREAA